MLAKAELTSDSGGASVTIYLRNGKKHCTTAAGREEGEYVRETTLQARRSVRKELQFLGYVRI